MSAKEKGKGKYNNPCKLFKHKYAALYILMTYCDTICRYAGKHSSNYFFVGNSVCCRTLFYISIDYSFFNRHNNFYITILLNTIRSCSILKAFNYIFRNYRFSFTNTIGIFNNPEISINHKYSAIIKIG